MPRQTRHSPFARRAFLALAALAVMLKVLLPPGFMVSQDRAGFPLVICTSQGNVVVHGDDGPGKPAGKAGHDAPCAFAGNGAVDIAPSLAAPAPVAFAAYETPAPRAFASLAPGRGLAAPPPPSRGPPRFLTI